MKRSELLNHPGRPRPAPDRFGGQWVAWDRDRQNIVAHGASLPDVHDAAEAAGHADASFERVPRSNEIFLGRT
jgi:hypothetical protein